MLPLGNMDDLRMTLKNSSKAYRSALLSLRRNNCIDLLTLSKASGSFKTFLLGMTNMGTRVWTHFDMERMAVVVAVVTWPYLQEFGAQRARGALVAPSCQPPPP